MWGRVEMERGEKNDVKISQYFMWGEEQERSLTRGWHARNLRSKSESF